jgi:hypothetical protein
MYARYVLYVCALGFVPAAIWTWFSAEDEAPVGQVWIAWVIVLGGPALLTTGVGLLTRRRWNEIVWVAIASTAVTLVPILLVIWAISETVS